MSGISQDRAQAPHVPEAISEATHQFAEAMFFGMRKLDGRVNDEVKQLRHTLEVKARLLMNQGRFAEEVGHSVASGLPLHQYRNAGEAAWHDVTSIEELKNLHERVATPEFRTVIVHPTYDALEYKKAGT